MGERSSRGGRALGVLGAAAAGIALALGCLLALESGLGVALASQVAGLAPVAAGPALLGAAEEPEIHPLSSVYIPVQCRDGLDNDADGHVDYPDDPGCVDADDLAEHDPVPPPPGSAFFQGMGTFPGQISRALDVSDDGAVVVGSGSSGSFVYGTALRWEDGVLEALERLDPAGFGVQNVAVSGDGRVIVGYERDASARRRGFRWEEGELEELESLGGQVVVSDVSHDGSVIVGSVRPDPPFTRIPARWDDGVPTLLDFLPGAGSFDGATSVSADGHVVFARDDDQPVQWIGSTPGLLVLEGWLWVLAASDDGSVLVGRAGLDAFRWEAGVTETLAEGISAPLAVAARDVSADGALVVGDGPSIWDASGHMRNLAELMVNDYGLDLGGWRLRPAYGISGDGRTVVGWGEDPNGVVEGWILRLPPSCSDGLDNDGDGLIDAREDPDCFGRSWLVEGGSCGRPPWPGGRLHLSPAPDPRSRASCRAAVSGAGPPTRSARR